MQITDSTPFTDITVQGLTFSAPQPYSAGSVELTEGEASQLNQVLAENLRNNFAAKIRAKVEAHKKANNMAEDADVGADVLDKDELDNEFEAYAKEYEFGVRQASSGPRAPADPVGKEAYRMARAKIKEAVIAKGYKLDSVSKERMDGLIKQLLEKNPAIREEAERRVNATAEIALADVDL